MIWYDTTHDIWYNVIYDIIWYDIWYDMIYMICDMIWYNVIRVYDIYDINLFKFVTAVVCIVLGPLTRNLMGIFADTYCIILRTLEIQFSRI